MVNRSACVAILCATAVIGGLETTTRSDEPADWVLENCVDAAGRPTTSVVSGAQCDLKNRKSGTCLVRQSNQGQVDWQFASCTARPRQMRITARDPGPVVCGETFALKLGNEYFRKCRDPQTVGINICSEAANTPQPIHFDWQFTGCTGQVEAGRPVALYNVSRKDSVVYAKRPGKVVDTCWSDKTKFGNCTTSRDK